MTGNTSKVAARRRVREAQVRANEGRAQRERDNLEDAATIVVCLGKVGEIDIWEAERLANLRKQVRADADRKRAELRCAGRAAVVSMQHRGETLTTVAKLAGAGIAEIRVLLRSAPAIDNPISIRSASGSDTTTEDNEDSERADSEASLDETAASGIASEPAQTVVREVASVRGLDTGGM